MREATRGLGSLSRARCARAAQWLRATRLNRARRCAKRSLHQGESAKAGGNVKDSKCLRGSSISSVAVWGAPTDGEMPDTGSAAGSLIPSVYAHHKRDPDGNRQENEGRRQPGGPPGEGLIIGAHVCREAVQQQTSEDMTIIDVA